MPYGRDAVLMNHAPTPDRQLANQRLGSGGHRRWRRASPVFTRRLFDGHVVLGAHSPAATRLSGLAALIWDALDRPRTDEELTRSVTAASGRVTTQQVREARRDLVEAGLVVDEQ